jgi:hypothetical protein
MVQRSTTANENTSTPQHEQRQLQRQQEKEQPHTQSKKHSEGMSEGAASASGLSRQDLDTLVSE